MPYGTDTSYSSSAGSVVISRNTSPTGTTDLTIPLGADVLTYEKYYTRGGNNGTSVRLQKRERNPAFGHWEERYFYRRNGPRLNYKVYNSKIKRYVWAKRRIKYAKLVWVPNRTSGRKKGWRLPPNSMNYQLSTVSAGRSSQSLKGVYLPDPRYYREVDFEVWYPRPSFIWSHGMYDYSNYISSGLSPSTQFASDITALESKALSSLYERVKNQSVNFGQIIAERRMTLSTVKDVVTRVAQTLMALKRGQLQKAAKILFPQDSKQLANDHLMIQYGIMPLISDLKGIAEYVSKPSKSFRFTEKVTKRKVISDMPVDHTTKVGITCQTRVNRDVEIIVKYQCTMEIEFPGVRPLAELGLINLASLGWELTPYSFVIDWLIPIGNYLNSLDAFAGLKVISTHKSCLIREKNEVVRTIGGKDNSNYTWDSASASVTCRRVSFLRTVLPNLPDPPLPSVKDPVSFMHAANAIALIRQLFK